MLYRSAAYLRWTAFGLVAAALLIASPMMLRGQGGPSAEPAPVGVENTEDAPASEAEPKAEIRLLELLFRGGVLMLPIAVMSLLVVTVGIERFIYLRRSRILPDQLVARLGQLGGPQGGFDPRQAYRICQQFPSSAAVVIRAMLLKIGRPHAEVERSVAEASEREADRLYSNVRWLNLAAAVTPLLGLLGTVWGMIRAFHDTTMLDPSRNKADYLAEGIYVALVTTLAGLAIAIPAAILSHYYESRIQTLFNEINELLFNLLPQVERFEGRVRFGRQWDQEGENGNGAAAAADESHAANPR